ncbi:hypothetical protein [Streptomyces albipurpureus]|uniref:Aminoglycoside phosphotransferase domain-containing protein n=1 Tax=Streptomyces albipurpureus TaxID=2897419 RepID=A0ABT0V3E3_9ACTN|nr:hypothetical protein [Streptomyces sp. CWNU-1]MCM2393896.1 hypothetical protein [Streptomyces sp. CWNU-1]
MHPPPEDAQTAQRMRTAHRRARSALGVRLAPAAREAWGWRGRTLSRPVSAPGGPAWLRLAGIPANQADLTFWDGPLTAEECVPTAVPRPRLRAHHDWDDPHGRYRAELYDHTTAPTISSASVLIADPDLPGHWWTALRTALEAVAAVPTSRHTITQRYLDWAMPRFLGVPLDTGVRSWRTAHGDLHWANLCAPSLQIVDWEGWGLAPAGYDAAMLHTCSLLVPSTAERIRSEFGRLLDTPAGRFAELVTITELLHHVARGDHLPLTAPLHQRAAHLLHRADR